MISQCFMSESLEACSGLYDKQMKSTCALHVTPLEFPLRRQETPVTEVKTKLKENDFKLLLGMRD